MVVVVVGWGLPSGVEKREREKRERV